MCEELVIRPIAHIYTDFKDKFGIPRQSGRAKSLCGKIVFEPQYRSADALRELEGFSYIWLLFDFSKSHRGEWSPTVRPPRLGGNRRVGVFASRSPFRPNPIGLSSVKLLKIEKTKEQGCVLHVSGVDILDGTPIYDIKPYLPFSDSHPEAKGGYSDEVCEKRLFVEFPEELLEKIPEEKREAVLECLKEDPRPAYHDEPDRVYSMRFAGIDIHFQVAESILKVTSIDTF